MGYGNYYAVGRGLNKIFVGGILSIFSFIPLLGSILALVGLILTLVGLNEASQVEYDYKTAFMLSIAAIVLNILGLFLPFMNLIASILNFAVVYCICNTTAAILDAEGDGDTAAKGRFVWKLYVVCTIIMVVCGLLALIPGVVILAALVIIPTAIASVVAGIQYLIFLYRASNFLS